jgi:hypothetical protein
MKLTKMERKLIAVSLSNTFHIDMKDLCTEKLKVIASIDESVMVHSQFNREQIEELIGLYSTMMQLFCRITCNMEDGDLGEGYSISYITKRMNESISYLTSLTAPFVRIVELSR